MDVYDVDCMWTLLSFFYSWIESAGAQIESQREWAKLGSYPLFSI